MIGQVFRKIQRFGSALRGDGLKARAGRGATWTIGSIAISKVLRLGSNLILTRLLFPEAFGMMALVQIFITGLALFSDTGIRTSIIRSDRGDDPAFLNTAWTIGVMRGVVLWLFACVIAAPVALLYQEPLLAALLPVAGLTAIINGFHPTRAFTTSRNLVLGRLTAVNIAAQTVGIIATIVLAWLLQSVWALVFGTILSAIGKQVLLWTALPGHRDRFQIERAAVGEFFHFGKWLFVSTICGFLINHADRAILGKFISLDLLGIFTVGFLLASVPLMLGRQLAGRIVFPLYKHRPPWENPANQSKVFRVRWKLTGALLTISAVLLLVGNQMVHLLYDPRYMLAGPILILMVISQLPAVILCSYDQILLAAGDSKRFMSRVVTNAFAQTTLVVAGVIHFGLIGAILAPGLAAILVYPVLISAVRRYDGWDRTHDIVYFLIAIMIAAVGLWFNYDAVMLLVAETSAN